MVERCTWSTTDPLLTRYHDEEWGVPEHDDVRLFGKLVLDGFQAGLSWLLILRKRDNFRRAFDNFDPERMARWDARKLAALSRDAGIIRNRAKLEGARKSARAFLAFREAGGSFDELLWSFTGGSTRTNRWRASKQIPAATDESRAMAKELKRLGFAFAGPTVCYAFMQAVGMVNDHLTGCFRYGELTS